ncbi:hypothetical protein AALP_AAs42715U000100 [Arabis alpina]|uniref:Terpene synthase metal-binding domain-containing protein n=1 Tax=Arabis alpina TaxID=50452 RepID=A0A087G1P4_ARAAL|nr:hypothetical protein AALP_AAs42715U000100 [Arabis alpina]
MAGEEDLYTVSIIFWVFRTYGHYISSDVFRRFKIDGNFKESLNGDANGILSLYEAAHLQTTIASSHLESLDAGGTCPTHLSMRMRKALTLSQHWSMEIVAAVEYISSYEQEKDHDQMLLNFAKISFKFVQFQYLQDLKIVAKYMVQGGILDDTFDRYLSLREAESLANSLKRRAPDHAMDKQPDYMKFVFNFTLDTFEEFESERRPEGTVPYSVKATIEEFKIFVEANLDLEKWAQAAHVPSFEEYMEVGEVVISVYASMAVYFMCLGKMGTKKDYEWLKSRPKLIKYVSTKGRLMNDIYGFEDDMSRGFVTNAVNCYMKQYGVTKQEALRELHIMVADADKTINEELLTTTGVSRLVLKAAMGNAQIIAILYNGYEGFTNPEGKTKEYMTSILVDQICL